MDQQQLAKAGPGKTAERRGVQTVTGADLAERSGEGVCPQFVFTLLDQRRQVIQQRPDPWRLLGVPGGIEGEHRQGGGDLFQGNQEFLRTSLLYNLQ